MFTRHTCIYSLCEECDQMSLENSSNTADNYVNASALLIAITNFTLYSISNHRLAGGSTDIVAKHHLQFFACQKLNMIDGPNST